MRELVGEDGEAIADYLFSVMNDEKARTADRLEAAKLLADRAFGRSVQTVDLDVTAHRGIDVTKISTEDLHALVGMLKKYEPRVAEVAATGEIEFWSTAAAQIQKG